MPPIEDDNWSNVVFPPRARSAPVVAEPPSTAKSAIFAGVALLLSLLFALPPYLLWSRGLPDSPSPSRIFSGYIFWPLLFASMLGYAAYRLRDRSKTAFNITFGVILLLTLVTHGGQPRKLNGPTQPPPGEFQNFVAEAEKIKSEMRDLEASGQLSEINAATLQGQLDRMEAVVQKGTGEQGRIMRASFSVVRKLLEAQIRSKAPLERFNELGGLETSGVTSKDQIVKRLAPVREYRKHIADALAVTKNWRSVLIEGGKAEGFTPSETMKLIGGEEVKLEAKMKHARIIHSLELEAADAIKETLELFRDEWGAWHVDDTDDAIAFENDEAVEKYTKLMDRLGEIEEKQTRLIKESLRSRR